MYPLVKESQEHPQAATRPHEAQPKRNVWARLTNIYEYIGKGR